MAFNDLRDGTYALNYLLIHRATFKVKTHVGAGAVA